MSTRGILLFFALLVASGRAQVTTATFYATITDASGAVVPSAPVTLVHEETSTAITRQTNEAGEVSFDFLRVGTYLVRVGLIRAS